MDWTAPLPPGLVAKPDRPQCSSKHKSWFEFIENKDKKKKLEIEVMTDQNLTTKRQTGACMRVPIIRVMNALTNKEQFTENREPPPGFEFVPIGNPTLTSACKELSREQGAMIFIVTVCYKLCLSTLEWSRS